MRRTTRTRAARLAAVVLVAMTGLGCDDAPAKPSTSGSRSAGSTRTRPTASASTTSTGVSETPPPDGLDAAKLADELKCHGKSEPCAILDEFKACKDWNPQTPGGDGRWLGRSWVMKDGAYVPGYVVLRSRRVAQSEVAPGQLGAKIGIVPVPSDIPNGTDQARKAVDALARGDVPMAATDVMTWVKDTTDWPEAFATAATRNQVYVVIEGGAYVCEREGKRLILYKRSAEREHPADGIYAELWPVSW